MHSRLYILNIVLSNYQRFLFYDASVSILKSRNFTHIHLFYVLFSQQYLKVLEDINHLESEIVSSEEKELYKKKCNGILDEYINISGIISNESIDNIRNVLSLSARISIENLADILFSSQELTESFSDFIIAYNKLHKLFGAHISALLTEFHNTLSHLITAIVLKGQLETDSDNKKMAIINRNIDKAVSHLKRGTKDSYKILIKATYKMYEKYNKQIKLPDGFREKFIQIRSEEIIHLSNKSNHKNIHNSIKELSEELIECLKINKNQAFKEQFVKLLEPYMLM